MKGLAANVAGEVLSEVLPTVFVLGVATYIGACVAIGLVTLPVMGPIVIGEAVVIGAKRGWKKTREVNDGS